MERKGSAVWKGGLKDGKGTVSTASGILSNTPYNFAQRFDNAPGTNPEELIGAAHAACFSMALSGQLRAANLTAERIETTSTSKVEKLETGFTIAPAHLEVKARVPNADQGAFTKAAQAAET